MGCERRSSAVRRSRNRYALVLLLAPLLACAGDPAGRPHEEPGLAGPHVLVLGTVQDGGFPHVACSCESCVAARRDPRLARRVASLALVVPSGDRAFLIDATPDIEPQLERLRRHRGRDTGGVDRSPLDGILLTHAHWGHYAGLGFLGFESAHARALPVGCSETMARYLANNGPWDQLIRLRNVVLEPFAGGQALELAPGLRVTPVPVPHRDEYSDTVALLVEGPRRRLLYVPDTDGWPSWQPSLLERLAGVDVAILDGTFFSLDELPDRDVRSIGHPLIVDTMALLDEAVRRGRLRVYFTHLNHSNPALRPGSAARAEIARRGFDLLQEGQTIPL